MSDYSCITVSRQGAVVEISLNRPAQLNALSTEMVNELRHVLSTVGTHDDRALLLTGSGKGFCSGADLAGDTFAEGGGRGFGASVSRSLEEVFNPLIRDLYNLQVPTVSAINGVAAGGGVGLALSADICIAGSSASFVQVFGPRLGIVPDAGSSWFVAHLVGRARALGMALLGDKISAETAFEWGLVWKCVEDAVLLDEARSVARRLAEGPTKAFPRIRALTDVALRLDLSAQLDLERDEQRVLCDSQDTREAVAAFREKRRPVFMGR